ncbi:MAG: TSUP family transporter [Candidatus Gallimonas sp.]
MAFYFYLVCGVLGGVLGGMGMGGGTVLIPLLTLLCGVEQGVAQGVNLLSFLPMSVLALSVHAKNGLLKKRGLALFVPPALACSVAASFLAARLPSVVLRRAFGVFLVALSLFQFRAAFRAFRARKAKALYKNGRV